MYKYLNFQTKLYSLDKIIVFTTNKTLNQRFTPSATSRSFTVSNGYTNLYENNYIDERIVFKNRRSMDIHKRISLYELGKLEEIKREVFECEDKNNHVRVTEISSRRTVVKPKKWSDEESTKNYKEFEKQRALSPDDYNMSSLKPIEINASKDLKFYELMHRHKLPKKGNKISRYSFINENSSVKHSRNGRIKDKNAATDDYHSKDYQGSEPILYRPSKTKRHLKTRKSKSLYKWKRSPPTKEELDDELDGYMSETKCKEPSKIPAKDDVDSFVREYMLETENL